MERNPFSLYDFMGYLFPGCLFIVVMTYLYRLDFDIYRIADLNNLYMMTEKEFNWEKSVLLIILGYTVGHCLAYISSLSIETLFTIKVFGYPSNYLLTDNTISLKQRFLDYFSSESKSMHLKIIEIIVKIIVKFFNLLLIFPITIGVFGIGHLLGINSFIVRPLDRYLQNTLKNKEYKLADRLQITHPDVNETCDYHRIVMHYVYLNMPESQRKIDNYLALYGFLRSLCFIMCFFFGVISILAVRTIGDAPVDYGIVTLLVYLFLLAYILFLGFIKFYRRFTLENLMTLLVGMTIDENESRGNVGNINIG